MKDLGIVGTVARFKPVHKAHEVMLEALCERSAQVTIGIGSSNRYDVTNPFTAAESKEMIDSILRPQYANYTVIEVPDLWNGPKWREQALRLYGSLDRFVTANDYVTSLLERDYAVVHPGALISPGKGVPVTGTMVRHAMARGEPWEPLVPDPVATYLKDRGIDARFCREFGLATIAHAAAEALEGEEIR